jgi:hypothetical protein
MASRVGSILVTNACYNTGVMVLALLNGASLYYFTTAQLLVITTLTWLGVAAYASRRYRIMRHVLLLGFTMSFAVTCTIIAVLCVNPRLMVSALDDNSAGAVAVYNILVHGTAMLLILPTGMVACLHADPEKPTLFLDNTHTQAGAVLGMMAIYMIYGHPENQYYLTPAEMAGIPLLTVLSSSVLWWCFGIYVSVRCRRWLANKIE